MTRETGKRFEKNLIVSGLQFFSIFNESEVERFLKNNLRPLTKLDSSGEPLTRQPEIEAQIISILALDKHELLRRVAIGSQQSPDYLREETLIYLLREANAARDFETENAVSKVLRERTRNLVYKRIRKTVQNIDAAEDLTSDVLSEMFAGFSTPDDRHDFAQARFGLFIKRFTDNLLRKTVKTRKYELLTDSIDETNEEGFSIQLEAASRISETDLRDIKKMLNMLPPQIAQAYVLRHYHGWQIESGDPNEETISKFCGVSEKTIRNRLGKAQKFFDERRGKETL